MKKMKPRYITVANDGGGKKPPPDMLACGEMDV